MATIDKYKIVVETDGAEKIDNLNDAAGRAGTTMANLIKLTGAALLTGFAAMAKSAVSLSKDMVDLGGLAGQSAGKIYQMSVAAEASGGSFDQTSTMLMKYSKAVEGVNNGNKDMIASFAEVGVSSQDVKTLNDEQLFQKVVEGLGAMEDGAHKTALAVKLLGKDAATTDLAKFAEMTKEAVDPKLEENMRKAAKAVEQLQTAFRNAQMAVLMAIGPILDSIGELNFSMEDASRIANTIGTVFKAAFAVLGPIIGLITRNFEELSIALGLVFGAAMLANVAKMTMAMRLFAASNPFTLIAMAVGTLIVVVADLIKKYGGFSNTMKMVANVGIQVLNKMINAYKSFGLFVAELFKGVGRAIMAGLNPFSDSSAVEELRRGLNKALSTAKSTIESEGPIKFRFAVDPVPTRGGTTRTPGTGGARGVLGDEQSLTSEKGKQAAAARQTLEDMRRQGEEARRATNQLIEQNRQTSALRELNIELIGLESDRATLIRSNAEAQAEAANEIGKLQETINDEVAKGAQANRLVIDELKKQIDEKRNQLDVTLRLNQAEYDRRMELGMQQNLLQKQLATMEALNQLEVLTEGELLRSQLIRGKLTREQHDRELSFFNLQKEFDLKRRQDEEKLIDLIKRKSFIEADALLDTMELDRTRFELRKGQLKVEQDLTDRLRESSNAGIVSALEAAKRMVDPFVIAEQSVASLFSNMNSAIDNFVDTGKFKFGDFARSIIADIVKIQLKAAATNIIGGIFGSIFPSVFGRAAGGPVQKNTPYLVGESGPELFIPGSMGSILTNASLNTPSQTGNTQPTKVINNYTTNNISAIDSKSVAQMFIENRKSLLGAATIAQKEMPYGI